LGGFFVPGAVPVGQTFVSWRWVLNDAMRAAV